MGTTRSEKAVDAKIPKIKAHARPENTGSRVITHEPNTAAPAVRRMGVKRTAPDSRIASLSVSPSRRRMWMKSTSIMEFLTTY